MQRNYYIFLLAMGLLSSSPISMAQQGKVLHDAACIQCHASLSGGDPYQLYQRQDRKVKSLKQLDQQVSSYALVAGVSWTSTERAAVVEYLRSSFYPF